MPGLSPLSRRVFRIALNKRTRRLERRNFRSPRSYCSGRWPSPLVQTYGAQLNKLECRFCQICIIFGVVLPAVLFSVLLLFVCHLPRVHFCSSDVLCSRRQNVQNCFPFILFLLRSHPPASYSRFPSHTRRQWHSVPDISACVSDLAKNNWRRAIK